MPVAVEPVILIKRIDENIVRLIVTIDVPQTGAPASPVGKTVAVPQRTLPPSIESVATCAVAGMLLKPTALAKLAIASELRYARPGNGGIFIGNGPGIA